MLYCCHSDVIIFANKICSYKKWVHGPWVWNAESCVYVKNECLLQIKYMPKEDPAQNCAGSFFNLLALKSINRKNVAACILHYNIWWSHDGGGGFNSHKRYTIAHVPCCATVTHAWRVEHQQQSPQSLRWMRFLSSHENTNNTIWITTRWH